MIKEIWSGVKTIFGGNSDKILDMTSGIGSFIDESFHTEEEKSDANIKLLDLKIKLANATQGQNLARRYCAMIFGLNYVATFQVCLMLSVYDFIKGKVTSDKAIDSIIDLAISFQLGYIMLLIIIFYFGKEVAPHIKAKMQKRKSP
tara:strand:+ start:516 stop:953 length:438 start_codon:yes stop_codon:yes gene_type:complete